MAKIKRIIVHCTASLQSVRVTRAALFHQFFELNGWKHWGYHAVIHQDGRVEYLQPLPRVTADGGFIDNATLANGAKGYNWDSLHIAYVGGLLASTGKPADTRTVAQKSALREVIHEWKTKYQIEIVVGHRDLPDVNKACPCFNAIPEYRYV